MLLATLLAFLGPFAAFVLGDSAASSPLAAAPLQSSASAVAHSAVAAAWSVPSRVGYLLNAPSDREAVARWATYAQVLCHATLPPLLLTLPLCVVATYN